MKIQENLQSIIAIGLVVGMVMGALSYFATAEELKATQQRLDYKIVSDQAKSVQDRIWKIQDRCGPIPKDPTTKEELRQLEKSKQELDEKLKVMEKK